MAGVAASSTRRPAITARVTAAWIGALLMVSGLSLEAFAAADVRDANDTRGALDVRSVHRVGGDRPIWRIVTRARWRARLVFDRGYLLVYVDTFGKRRADYYALLWSNGKRMRGTLVRDRRRGRRDRTRGPVTVWRRNRRSASVRIPLDRLFFPQGRPFYRWHVRTLMIKGRCPKSVCIDRGPDRGAIRQHLPV